MKAENFAQRIINNLTHSNKLSNFEFILLRDLCLYSSHKKKYFYYVNHKEICISGYFYKYSKVTSFYDKLGIKYESVALPHNVYGDFYITKNTFRNIKLFLDEIRQYFVDNHNVKILYSKYDGSVISISNAYNITEIYLLEAIKHITNKEKISRNI